MMPLDDYSDFFRSGFRAVGERAKGERAIGERHRRCTSAVVTGSACQAPSEGHSDGTRSSRRSSIVSFSSRLFERVRSVSFVPPRFNQPKRVHSRQGSSDSQSHGYRGDISVSWSESGRQTPSSIASLEKAGSLHVDAHPFDLRSRSRPQSLQINTYRQSIDPFASSPDAKSFFIDLTETPPSPTPLAFYSHFSPPSSEPPSRPPSIAPPSPSKLESFLSLSLSGISPSQTPDRRSSRASSLLGLPIDTQHLQLPPHNYLGNPSRRSLHSLLPLYLRPSPPSSAPQSRRSSLHLYLKPSRPPSRNGTELEKSDLDKQSWFILEEVFASDSKLMAREVSWDGSDNDNKHPEELWHGLDDEPSKLLDWRQIHVDLLNDDD